MEDDVKGCPVMLGRSGTCSLGTVKIRFLLNSQSFYGFFFRLFHNRLILKEFQVWSLKFGVGARKFKVSTIHRTPNIKPQTSNIKLLSTRPPLSIQTPVLYRFCQMLRSYILTCCQVGNSAAYF